MSPIWRRCGEVTPHVAGLSKGCPCQRRSLSPSPRGAFATACAVRLHSGSGVIIWRGLTVCGSGARACRAPGVCGAVCMRRARGSWWADIDAARVDEAVAVLGATGCAGETRSIAAEADIFAPCALGAVLNARSIPICGRKSSPVAANNQLEEAADAGRLLARTILYVPRFRHKRGRHHQCRPRDRRRGRSRLGRGPNESSWIQILP